MPGSSGRTRISKVVITARIISDFNSLVTSFQGVPGKDKMCKTLFAMVTALICGLLFLNPIAAKAAISTATPNASVVAVMPVAYHPDTILTSENTYIVKPGDTLSAIGSRFGIPWLQLYCENKTVIGTDPNILQVGEKLALKPGKCQQTEPATTTTTAIVKGTPQQIAWNLLSSSNRAEEFSCLDNIINRESGWNLHAENPYSFAYGIPQALPGSKMAGSWGTDWVNSAYVQLYWMIKVYIPASYGTPCGAWLFWQAHSYY